MLSSKEPDQDTVDSLLIQYMRGRGFTASLEAFKSESKTSDLIGDITLDAHTNVSNIINPFRREESSPSHYVEAYRKLQAWIETSIDIYRYEMQKILWPLLVHVFLDMVQKNFIHQAQKLMEANIRVFKKKHVQEITKLQQISSQADLKTNSMAKYFLEKKTKVTMSQFSHQLLFSFLEQSSFMLLLRLLNEHVQISATTRAPLSRKDIDALPKQETNQMEEEDKLNQEKFEFWGALPAENELHSIALAKGFGGILQPGISLGGGGDSSSMSSSSQQLLVAPQPMTIPPDKAVPIPDMKEREKQKRLKDLQARIKLGAPNGGGGIMPSICMYTLLNAESSTSICISRDASLVASGFGDSTVKMWNLEKARSYARSWSMEDKKKKKKAAASLSSSSSAAAAMVLDGSTSSSNSNGVGAEIDPSLMRDVKLKDNNNNNNNNNNTTSSSSTTSSSFVGGSRRAISKQEIDGTWPLYKKLVGHRGPVFCADFSHDKEFLLTGSQDCTIRLWNTETALSLASYRGHSYPVWDVTFSPVGYYFASASLDTTARLWCTHRSYPLRLFAGHQSDVQCVRFHPNSNVIATGSLDKTVRLWDV